MVNDTASGQRLKTLLKEAITILCKNGIEYKSKFTIEALVGITIDDGNVILVNINETVKGTRTASKDDFSKAVCETLCDVKEEVFDEGYTSKPQQKSVATSKDDKAETPSLKRIGSIHYEIKSKRRKSANYEPEDNPGLFTTNNGSYLSERGELVTEEIVSELEDSDDITGEQVWVPTVTSDMPSSAIGAHVPDSQTASSSAQCATDITSDSEKQYVGDEEKGETLLMLESYIEEQVGPKEQDVDGFQEPQLAEIDYLSFLQEGQPLPRLPCDHQADFIQPSGTKSRPQKRCRVCYRRGVRKDVRSYCPHCHTQPALCFPKCFLQYHNENWEN